MSEIASISQPQNELERLITELSESANLVFVFGVGWWTARLTGTTTPLPRAGRQALVACRAR